MTDTGIISKSFNPATAYQHSFGALNGGTVYHNPWANETMIPDLKARLDAGMKIVHQKALTTISGGPGTAGQAMIPVYVDPRIVDTTRKYTPLVEMVPRVTNLGITADYNKVTTKRQQQARQKMEHSMSRPMSMTGQAQL